MCRNSWFFILITIGFLINVQSAFSQQCANAIIVVAPGNNLQTLINNNPSGTCFYFPDGNYTFGNTVPKDDMIFEGQSRSEVQLNGNGHENAFHGIAHNVTIKNMTFFNFNSNGGVGGPLQEQSPIRGSANIWANAGDALAVIWHISIFKC